MHDAFKKCQYVRIWELLCLLMPLLKKTKRSTNTIFITMLVGFISGMVIPAESMTFVVRLELTKFITLSIFVYIRFQCELILCRSAQKPYFQKTHKNAEKKHRDRCFFFFFKKSKRMKSLSKKQEKRNDILSERRNAINGGFKKNPEHAYMRSVYGDSVLFGSKHIVVGSRRYIYPSIHIRQIRIVDPIFFLKWTKRENKRWKRATQRVRKKEKENHRSSSLVDKRRKVGSSGSSTTCERFYLLRSASKYFLQKWDKK